MDQTTLARTRRRWRFYEPGLEVAAAGDRLSEQLRVDRLVGRLLVRRGISGVDEACRFLDPKLTHLHDPALLPGIDDAVRLIVQAVRCGRPIVVYGDYDVDGITASSILWHVLKQAGAKVSTYTPHRIDDGYGLNSDAIRQLAESPDGKPLIISVDCGITALEPARVARELGVELIITDHHEFEPDALPEASAIVHPRLPGSKYPFGYLCGAGVAFKVAWQFARVHCGSQRVPESFRALLLDLLSLAALGTVADVVPLVNENRVITRHGLGHIKRTSLPGLAALLDASRLSGEKIDAYHVGFVLGPRLNACGRMGHAGEAVRLLTEADATSAAQIASFLATENDRRRQTERLIYDEAHQMVLDGGHDSDDRRAIVLGKADWHVGVMGIVASRLVESFCRPVVLLSFDNGRAQGSARSVPGLSVHDAMQSCAPLLTSFGGHAMAAGVRLETQNVDAFRDQFVAYVNNNLTPSDLRHELQIDTDCTLADLDVGLFEQLERLAPFGRDNPAPLLCLRDAGLDEVPRRVGSDGSHARLVLRQGSRQASAIGFGLADQAAEHAAGDRIDVAFVPKMGTWKGRMQLELHVKDLRAAGDGDSDVAT